jgi:hypothetical protein
MIFDIYHSLLQTTLSVVAHAQATTQWNVFIHESVRNIIKLNDVTVIQGKSFTCYFRI